MAKEAFKLRAEIVERSFAHNLDRGGMRRTWLRGRENVHKRYLLHVAGHNLSLLMRKLIGAGTPREAVAGGYGCICVLIAPDLDPFMGFAQRLSYQLRLGGSAKPPSSAYATPTA